ncbi:MAG: hypothetical protein ACJ75B_19670 [Flavisolibacter sp.]
MRPTKMLLFPATIALILGASVLSCTKGPKEIQATKEKMAQELKSKKEKARLANGSYTCGEWMDGTRSTLGYYVYSQTIDLSNVATGATVNIVCNALDVPNRFTVYDAGHSFVAGSDWRGYSTTSGYWGPPFSRPGDYTITFTKGSSNTYIFEVETSIQDGNSSDYWQAHIDCTSPVPPDCTGDTCVHHCSCNYTTSLYQTWGSYNSGYHVYKILLDLSLISNNQSMQVACNALDVPNRFTIYDGNHNFVAGTAWMGYSSTSGYWGPPFNNPGTQYINFTKGTSSIYYLEVETSVQDGNSSDAWSADIYCH